MDMQGEYRIPATRETVWNALNDPEILKQAITGCESLDQTEDGGFEAVVKAKVGPVKATFKGAVRLENVTAPESYTIVGEGKGGAAGFAKGGADVVLRQEGDATILTYTVKAQVGGKLAQIGGRLIDSTAKKYANDFFSKFVEILSNPSPSRASETMAQEGANAPASAADERAHEALQSEADVIHEAKQAALEAVDAQKAARKSGLTPTQWILFVVIALFALTYLFGSGNS